LLLAPPSSLRLVELKETIGTKLLSLSGVVPGLTSHYLWNIFFLSERVHRTKNADFVIFSDSGSTVLDGNWYCQPVQAIRYSNVGSPGSYNRITKMEDGSCSSTPNAFSGALAPFDEEVSSDVKQADMSLREN
jgi:hypothetical protein